MSFHPFRRGLCIKQPARGAGLPHIVEAPMFETVDLLRTVKALILLKFGTSYINNFSKVRQNEK